jgi:hypothetical protein
VRRPSDLAVNGYCELASSSSTTSDNPIETVELFSESLDSDQFHVLPRELQDNSDFCGLNGDCDFCGGMSAAVEQVNGTDRYGAAGGRAEEVEIEDYDEEGAVGGEDLLMEVLLPLVFQNTGITRLITGHK